MSTDNNIIFTVITISLNSAGTIERTIRSVLSQSFMRYEYLIIDGGSTDGTHEIIMNYVNNYPDKIKYIREPDSGIYNAMNKGIAIAEGKMIAIINSDDWLERDTLRNVFDVIDHTDISNTIFCGWIRYHYFNGDSQILKTSNENIQKSIKKFSMGIKHPATIIPASIYRNIGYYDENMKISADVDFFLRAAKYGCSFYVIEKVLANMQDGGISKNISKNKYKDRVYLLKKHTNHKAIFYYHVMNYLIKNAIKIIFTEKALIQYRKNKN